jgi:Immunity protein 42
LARFAKVLVGDKARFGIEFEVDFPEVEGHKWLLGHVYFWANGVAIGDRYKVGSLTAAAHSMAQLLRYRGRRTASELMDKSSSEIFHLIDHALFVDDGRPDGQVEADWQRYSVYIAKPTGLGIFDGWKAYLIEDERHGRYIWRETRRRGSAIHEAVLKAGEFDDAVEAFIATVDGL